MATSKDRRHSLQVNPANIPKPLHILDSNIPNSPASAPLSSPVHSPYTPTKPNPRRQSSICYITNSEDSPSSRHSSLSRSNSTHNARSTSNPKKALRNSTGSLNGPKDRPPVTLAEKHADLLHFIAQKEAKCLELRSQLATHEAELAQLKRKWERVMSRGFPSTGPYSSSTIPSSSNTSSTVVLEGIREGVQGVGRFLAEFSSPPPPSPKISHKTHSSSSSLSTYASSSSAGTRSSLSSSSSLHSEWDKVAERSEQTLIVRDTGATPTVSPNPDFHLQQEQGRSSTQASLDRAAKIHRRKSREAPVAPVANVDEDDVKPVGRNTSSQSPGASWVGQVGKKWEEIQKTTAFTKSQKRASLLISDVSNTLYSAASAFTISSPPTPSMSPVILSPSPAITRTTKAAPQLIDDDPWSSLLQDDSNLSIGIMKPDPSPSSIPSPQTTKQNSDEDEDWNW